jgi:DNA-binding NarL/FixJ family response regulator
MRVDIINKLNDRRVRVRWRNASFFLIAPLAPQSQLPTQQDLDELMRFIGQCEFYGFTPAETNVAIELSKGFTDEEIAKALNISTDTVNSHLNSIYDKLQVNTRSKAIFKLEKSGCTAFHFLK